MRYRWLPDLSQGLATGDRGGMSYTQNLPLKAGKGSVNEGGIRESMIVKWPGVTKPGSVAKQNVMIEDFFPTILQLAGIKNYKTIQHIDGERLIPILENPQYLSESRALVWHFPHRWHLGKQSGTNFFSAIRKGDWKLVYEIRAQKLQLYNLKEDIGEQNDVAKKYPTKVKVLATLLTNKLKG